VVQIAAVVRLTAQRPPSQKNPDWQLAAVVHGAAQLPLVHMLDTQAVVVPARQRPAPLQVLAAYSVPPSQ
jgi:hypothetical protein